MAAPSRHSRLMLIAVLLVATTALAAPSHSRNDDINSGSSSSDISKNSASSSGSVVSSSRGGGARNNNSSSSSAVYLSTNERSRRSDTATDKSSERHPERARGSHRVFNRSKFFEEVFVEHDSLPHLLSVLNLDSSVNPHLDGVREAVEAHDMAKVRTELLAAFRRKAREWKMLSHTYSVMKNMEVARNATRNIVGRFEGASRPRVVDFGDHIRWQDNPFWVSEGDAEWVWGLHRQPFWMSMAWAYNTTGDETFCATWIAQFRQWVRDNPRDPMYDYDWGNQIVIQQPSGQRIVTTTHQWPNTRNPHLSWAWRRVDAGRRGLNFPELLQTFIHCPLFDADVLIVMLNSLHEHATFITNNPHRHFTKDNHGLFEAEGAANIAIFFPEFTDGVLWRERSFELLRSELIHQVRPDGVHVENVLSYHAAAMRSFSETPLVARRNGLEDFPPWYWRKILNMARALARLSFPDGRSPQFGDHTSESEIAAWTALQWGTHFQDKSLLDYAAAALPDVATKAQSLLTPTSAVSADVAVQENADAENAMTEDRKHRRQSVLRSGRKSSHTHKQQQQQQQQSISDAEEETDSAGSGAFPTAFAFKWSGFYSMRSDWGPDGTVLVLRCGPGFNAHSHKDAGTFELFAGGRRLMPDSGCFTYTGIKELYPQDPSRRYFQGTAAHNTLTLGNRDAHSPTLEQSPYLSRKGYDDCGLLLWETRHLQSNGVDTADAASESNSKAGDGMDTSEVVILAIENRDTYALAPTQANDDDTAYQSTKLSHRRVVLYVAKSIFVIIDELIDYGIGNEHPEQSIKDNASFERRKRDSGNGNINGNSSSGCDSCSSGISRSISSNESETKTDNSSGAEKSQHQRHSAHPHHTTGNSTSSRSRRSSSSSSSSKRSGETGSSEEDPLTVVRAHFHLLPGEVSTGEDGLSVWTALESGKNLLVKGMRDVFQQQQQQQQPGSDDNEVRMKLKESSLSLHMGSRVSRPSVVFERPWRRPIALGGKRDTSLRTARFVTLLAPFTGSSPPYVSASVSVDATLSAYAVTVTMPTATAAATTTITFDINADSLKMSPPPQSMASQMSSDDPNARWYDNFLHQVDHSDVLVVDRPAWLPKQHRREEGDQFPPPPPSLPPQQHNTRSDDEGSQQEQKKKQQQQQQEVSISSTSTSTNNNKEPDWFLGQQQPCRGDYDVGRGCPGRRSQTGKEEHMTNLRKSLVYVEKHRFAYCGIPKCGVSRWRRLLRRVMGEATWADNQAHNPRANGLAYVSQLSPRAANRVLFPSQDAARRYFTFIIVRNPFARVLSAWLDKKDFSSFNLPQDFAAFVAMLEQEHEHENIEGTADSLNEHFAPMSSFCGVRTGVAFDFVGRLEEIDAWGPRLVEYLGIANYTLDGWNNKSFFPNSAESVAHNHNAYDKLDQHYTPDLMARVAKLYETDFTYFGYPTDRLH